MKTINSIIDQLTTPEILYNDLLETLRVIDPSYADEEAHFIDAVSRLKEELNEAKSSILDTYLSAAQEEIVAIIVFTSWLGFQLNLDCWKNPVNKLMLDQDYEEIVRERNFDTIPAIKQARIKAEVSVKAIPENQKDLFWDISYFFSYLHTVAPKLAHLFGFRLADKFLYHVIPGYCHDSVCTLQYTRGLENYLSLHHVS